MVVFKFNRCADTTVRVRVVITVTAAGIFPVLIEMINDKFLHAILVKLSMTE